MAKTMKATSGESMELGNFVTQWKNPALRDNLQRLGVAVGIALIGLLLKTILSDEDWRILGDICIGMGGFMFLIAVLLLPFGLFKLRQRVSIYDNGFVHTVGRKRTVVLYADIVSMKRMKAKLFVDRSLGMLGDLLNLIFIKAQIVYTIKTSGRTLKIGSAIIDNPDAFARQVQEKMLPKFLDDLEKSYNISFGESGMFTSPVNLGGDTIWFKSEGVRFANIMETKIDDDNIEIWVKDKKNPWLKVPLNSVENPWILFELVKQLAGASGLIKRAGGNATEM